MRLQAFLSQSGVASRRNVIQELEAGKVKVNGDVVRIPSYPIYPDKDEVTYEGIPVKLSRNKSYFVFNKPEGVITTAKDTHGRKTVLDFFTHMKERLYPVGRLDQDTTGLLLITNDGDLAHKLMHPRFGVKKIYEAILDREISSDEVERLKSGVVIEEGIKTSPCEIFVLETGAGKSKVEVVLHEGRKRQIRLMFQTLGTNVVHLHRKRYGPLQLKGLAPGKYRTLDPDEIVALKKMVEGVPTGQTPRQNRPNSRNRPPRFNEKRRPHFNRNRPNQRTSSRPQNAADSVPPVQDHEPKPNDTIR